MNPTCVAKTGAGEPIGVAMVSPDGQILLNYVSPDWIGNGVGCAMLGRLEELVACVGVIRVSSTVTARGFYLQNGFVAYADDELELEKRLLNRDGLQENEP